MLSKQPTSRLLVSFVCVGKFVTCLLINLSLISCSGQSVVLLLLLLFVFGAVFFCLSDGQSCLLGWLAVICLLTGRYVNCLFICLLLICWSVSLFLCSSVSNLSGGQFVGEAFALLVRVSYFVGCLSVCLSVSVGRSVCQHTC